MIRLDLNPAAAEPEWVELPAYTSGKGEDRVVPALHCAQPTLAALRAAQASARHCVPGRDEGEAEDAYVERLKATLAAYGASLPEGRLNLSARVEGAISAVATTALAEALIVGWRGFGARGGGDEEEIEPDETAIRAAMRDVYIAGVFDAWVKDKLSGRLSEGNG